LPTAIQRSELVATNLAVAKSRDRTAQHDNEDEYDQRDDADYGHGRPVPCRYTLRALTVVSVPNGTTSRGERTESPPVIQERVPFTRGHVRYRDDHDVVIAVGHDIDDVPFESGQGVAEERGAARPR